MKTEQAYGVVVVCKENDILYFLLLKQINPNSPKTDWSFPKGHEEEGENPKKVALRELYEEAGITDIKLLDLTPIHEEYEIEKDGEKRLKYNDYFIGFVKNKDVSIDNNEIGEYKWVTYEEGLNILQYKERLGVFQKAKLMLDMIE